MRELISAMDASHEASIRVALDAAGIPATVTPRPVRGAGAIPYWSIVSVEDDDHERAAAAIAGLRYTAPSDEPESPRFRLMRRTIGAAILIVTAYLLWRMIAT